MVLDVRETIISISLPPPTTPAIVIGNVNLAYLLKSLPVQQVGTLHFATLLATGNPITFPEVAGRPTDLFRGLPQGATLDAQGGATLPAPII